MVSVVRTTTTGIPSGRPACSAARPLSVTAVSSVAFGGAFDPTTAKGQICQAFVGSTGGYATKSADFNCNPDFNVYMVGAVTRWTPVKNLTFSAEVLWMGLDQRFTGTSDCWARLLRSRRLCTSSRTRALCPSTFALSVTSDPDRLTTLLENPRQETAGGFSSSRCRIQIGRQRANPGNRPRCQRKSRPKAALQ